MKPDFLAIVFLLIAIFVLYQFFYFVAHVLFVLLFILLFLEFFYFIRNIKNLDF